VSRGAWFVVRYEMLDARKMLSGLNNIGRCGFGVVEVLMWYGREVPASPEAAPRQAGLKWSGGGWLFGSPLLALRVKRGDLRFAATSLRCEAVYVSLLARMAVP